MGVNKSVGFENASLDVCNGMKGTVGKPSSDKSYPVRTDDLRELYYAVSATRFVLWAPTAEEVHVKLYEDGERGEAYRIEAMKQSMEGTWEVVITGDLLGKFYTFCIKYKGKWLSETPGINARAVGVNGHRGAIIDWNATNPEGWLEDIRPPLESVADIVLYEIHHRDFSIDVESGIAHRGKFLALTESGTHTSDGLSSGIDHLVQLGITHVHLLPSFDFASIDEASLERETYNWGYDPQNYNVPEGSYATDPFNPVSRILEFKQMVQALHRAGIRVVLDVVYNHVYDVDESNFELTVPGYFFRRGDEGLLSNGTGCGNETASERPMMRRYMVESVVYWANEYHIDGFRFDLMGIHDIETMNAIREALSQIDPTIYVYGEGWSVIPPEYPSEQLAMKGHISQMPGIAAFSDELRDGLRGPFFFDEQGGFLAGVPGLEESVKFGIVGAVDHPDVDYTKVNYSQKPWALQPTQMIAYVSCHDDLCLIDRLRSSIDSLSMEEMVRLAKLAQTIVLTSQGVPFVYAGEEMLRNKKGVRNSYCSADEVNAIDWHSKNKNRDVFDYYRHLIEMRKAHPAFRLGNAEEVRQKLSFLPVEGNNLVAFSLKDHGRGDLWSFIVVVFNARKERASVDVPAGKYRIVCKDGQLNMRGLGTMETSSVMVSPQSAWIMYQLS